MLKDKYNHLEVEHGMYDWWKESGFFETKKIDDSNQMNHEGKQKSIQPYCIVIPPPNVTGKLHIGHAWDTTIQDAIIRYKRLRGYDALYLPGMDHAGIATQAKVEEKLRQQKINKYDIGREAFLEEAWRWKKEYAEFIHDQWASLGLSLAYSKERFTLDEGLSDAVKKVFVQLYNEGLIYQGYRIINWDCDLQTALSNIEVIHKEVEGNFYYFKYFDVEDNTKYLEIATTRPETMFGDVCVVVHPKDKRYQDWIGKKVINPANNQPLEVISDDYIDIEFGTGVMKCTPAHDPNDFLIGKKYNLEAPICMNPDGTMNELAHKYQGMDRFVCREALIKDCTESKTLYKIEKHIHQVGHSERTNSIVEPYLSKQWFVKMEPLAKKAVDNQDTENKVNFYPNRFEKAYKVWMDKIEDWCISRQLWWGHRIPVWYHNQTEEIYVGETPPIDIENYTQDEDVLDTWFSSALWPFSTLNWPNVDDELFQRYYPTNTLVTGTDILFFWLSRMMFQAVHFTNQRPFENAIIHGLIRDEKGRKMSKSLGNGIDPMEVIKKYGCDSLRYFLMSSGALDQDLRFSVTKVEASWNYINKIWNASRFILLNLENKTINNDLCSEGLNNNLTIIDTWILNKFNHILEEYETNTDKFEFVVALSSLYKFVWDDFCSWYIELAKVNLNNSDHATSTLSVLVYVLKAILKMLHPYMPFVTEKIYQSLPHTSKSIMISSWPKKVKINDNEDLVDYLIDIILAIREIRAEYTIKKAIPLEITVSKDLSLINDYTEKMVNATIKQTIDGKQVSKIIKNGVVVNVKIEGAYNETQENEKLEIEYNHLLNEIKRAEGMLNNPNFVNKAPETKVKAEKEKLAEYQKKFLVVKQKLNK